MSTEYEVKAVWQSDGDVPFCQSAEQFDHLPLINRRPDWWGVGPRTEDSAKPAESRAAAAATAAELNGEAAGGEPLSDRSTVIGFTVLVVMGLLAAVLILQHGMHENCTEFVAKYESKPTTLPESGGVRDHYERCKATM